MARTERYKVGEVKAALEKTRGMVSTAAHVLGCSQTCVYGYLKRHPKLKKIRDDARVIFVDEAELKLMKHVRSENENVSLSASKYVLSTLGRDRGYVQRHEVVKIPTVEELAAMSDNELAELESELEKARS
jgi:hypothetical protein